MSHVFIQTCTVISKRCLEVCKSVDLYRDVFYYYQQVLVLLLQK